LNYTAEITAYARLPFIVISFDMCCIFCCTAPERISSCCNNLQKPTQGHCYHTVQ